MYPTPERFNKIAVKYQSSRWYLLLSVPLLMGVGLYLGSFENVNIVLGSLAIVLMTISIVMFFSSGFIFTFKKLNSRETILPHWYIVARMYEWGQVTVFCFIPGCLIILLVLNLLGLI